MTDPAIRIEGLSKEYVLGHRPTNGSFREAIGDAFAAPLRRLARGAASAPVERFWALKDVSLEIAPGEVVGIIGRNGAGKSTLLKVLSRITAPTKGRVEIRGRIASLLEVGTGFHQELTGRENVYLNGAILGMSRGEIRQKFDEIVAFAGVDKFIDTPVKRYSSGMQLRLAFAVAAHLEPEILLIDEVLAVGDAEFQKKCLGKIGEISAQGGRTVLFVSHQLGMVARLCRRAILMQGGSVAYSGATDQAIDNYLWRCTGAAARRSADDPRLRNLPAAILNVALIGRDGRPTDQFAWHQPIRVRVEVAIRQHVGGMLLGIAPETRHATRVTTWVARLADHVAEGRETAEIELEVEPRIIAPGGYTLTIALFEPKSAVYHKLEGECPFLIVDSGSHMAEFSDVDYGVAIIPARWSVPVHA
jgi:lipopolysaccharide transport system ATP-binding protein